MKQNDMSPDDLESISSDVISFFGPRLITLLSHIDNKSYSSIVKICGAITTKNDVRTTLIHSDGRIIYDSCKGDGNTFENYMNDEIGENHNSRLCVIISQIDKRGKGFESKFSNTLQHREYYFATRLGDYLNSMGVLRLSIRS